MVNGALGVDLGVVGSGGEGELGALENVEVVVGGMASGVAFGTDGGTWIIRMRKDTIMGGVNSPKTIRYSVILA